MTANQVINPPEISSASARLDSLTPAQLNQVKDIIAKEVAKEVAKQMATEGDRAGKDKPATGRERPPKIPPGACPIHHYLAIPHTWDQCRNNPAHK